MNDSRFFHRAGLDENIALFFNWLHFFRKRESDYELFTLIIIMRKHSSLTYCYAEKAPGAPPYIKVEVLNGN